MRAPCQPQLIRSLADAIPNERVEIQSIRFDGIRDYCAVLGVESGDVVRCMGRTRVRLLLHTAAGADLGFDLLLARFVGVRHVA